MSETKNTSKSPPKTQEVEEGEFTLVSSVRGVLYVDKLFKDGRRLTGKFTDDGWVEVAPTER